MDGLPLFLSLEQVYSHVASITGASKGVFLFHVRNLLASGQLRAIGHSRSTGRLVDYIPPDDWHVYQPFFHHGGVASRVIHEGAGDTRPGLPVFGWGDLRFHREEVLALWQEPAPPAPPAPPALPALPALPMASPVRRVSDRALDEYMKARGSGNINVIWPQAQAHFAGATLPRHRVRDSKARVEGKPGPRTRIFTAAKTPE